MNYAEEMNARIAAVLAATEAGRKQVEGGELSLEDSFAAVNEWLRILTEELVRLADYADGLHRDIHVLRERR